VITQLQLLFFSALAFTVLMRTGIYPPELKSVNLDSDWIYRRLMPRVIGRVAKAVSNIWRLLAALLSWQLGRFVLRLYQSHGPEGRMAQVWPTGSMVLWIAILLGVTLIVTFLS
jgi:multicomponent Na+:H+ antiporter subunit D